MSNNWQCINLAQQSVAQCSVLSTKLKMNQERIHAKTEQRKQKRGNKPGCDLRQQRRHSLSLTLSVSHFLGLSTFVLRDQDLLGFLFNGLFSIWAINILKISPTKAKFLLEAQKKKKKNPKNPNKPCVVELYRIGRKSRF